MTNSTHTDCILRQGKALLKAVESLSTIGPSGWFERRQARLLQTTYKQRLRAIAAAVPGWISEEILGASEHIGDGRAGVWMGENWE